MQESRYGQGILCLEQGKYLQPSLPCVEHSSKKLCVPLGLARACRFVTLHDGLLNLQGLLPYLQFGGESLRGFGKLPQRGKNKYRFPVRKAGNGQRSCQCRDLPDACSGQKYRFCRQFHLMKQSLLGVRTVYMANRAGQVPTDPHNVLWRWVEHGIHLPVRLDIGLDRTAIYEEAPHGMANRPQHDTAANQFKFRMPLQKRANQARNLGLGAQLAPTIGSCRISMIMKGLPGKWKLESAAILANRRAVSPASPVL